MTTPERKLTWIAYKRDTFIYWRRYFMGEACYFLGMAITFDMLLLVTLPAESVPWQVRAVCVAGNLACVWRGWLAVLRSALNRSLITEPDHA